MSSYPHLVQKIVKSKFNSCSSHSHSKPTSHGPRGVYKSWNDVCMQKAVKAVEEGVSIRVAADKYSVPRSSLHDRVSGKVGFQSHPGPSPYLSFEEE